MFLRAAVEQHDNQQTQQGEGNVAVDAPGERRGGAEPLVLRHHAEHDANGGEQVDGSGQAAFALDLVALPPDIVEQHIEDGHGDGGDPLAEAERHGVVFKAGGAQRQRAGDQVEGVASAQHDGHQTEQAELLVALASADHQNTDGDDRHQIDGVEDGFDNSLHDNFLFSDCLFLYEWLSPAGGGYRLAEVYAEQQRMSFVNTVQFAAKKMPAEG